MRKWSLAAALTLLFPAIAAAQQKPLFEIGTYTGVSFERMDIDGSKETITSIDVPQLGLYGAFFPSTRFMVEPELAFTRASGGGSTATGLGLIGSVGHAFMGTMMNSPYVAPAGGLVYVKLSYDEGDVDVSTTDWMAGARAGYRVVIRDALAMRFEGTYFRVFADEGDDRNIFALRIGIGGLLTSAPPRTAAR